MLNLSLPSGKDGQISGIDNFPVISGVITLAKKTYDIVNPSSVVTFKPERKLLIETAYIHLDSYDFVIDLTDVAAESSAHTLDPGYILRLAIAANHDRNVTFTGRSLVWIDGRSKTNPILSVSSSYRYLIEVRAIAGIGPFISQLTPK